MGQKNKNNWAKNSLVGLGLAGTGIGLTLFAGAANWSAETERAVKALKQSAITLEKKTVSFADFDKLPVPVARYFRFALKENQPIIRLARIKHEGEFNLNDKWIPFESKQHFSTNPPAFVWDAKMRMNPLMSVNVRDGYSNGHGSMLAKIFALFTVMNAPGKRDEKLAAGALQRYLAESVWQPTALLPRENLRWSPIDERRALATLTDSGVTVSLEFEFNESGEIVGIFSPARFREVGGEYKPFPWAGRFWNYQELGGMQIPIEGEVEWQMPEGRQPYWRGRIIEAEYEREDG
jgi:hypothetical protein